MRTILIIVFNLLLFQNIYGSEEIALSGRITPISQQNIFRDPDYYNWCSSIIKGKDGKYHMIYSRWERTKGFLGWLTHSEIAHAVSDHPDGPYRYVQTIISFVKDQHLAGEKINAHNPKIELFNGKYFIYFCSTQMSRNISDAELILTSKKGYSHENWKELRKNQRTFVASSSSLDKGWKIEETPLLEPSGPIETLVVNPAVAQGKDKRFYLIIKGDKPESTQRNQALAISKNPDKGFVIQPNPVIQDWDSEDISMWYDKKTGYYYAVFHAHTYIGMMTSEDGIHWKKAKDFVITGKKVEQEGGLPPLLPDRMERPFIFVENSQPKVLSLGIKKKDDSYIVTIPLK